MTFQIRLMLAATITIIWAGTFWAGAAWAGTVPAAPAFSAAEKEAILSHGPWPPSQGRDRSNRLSGKATAIRLGSKLFFDARLSANGKVACVTCHDPAKSFTDGKATGRGLVPLNRNTPTVLNAALSSWFGWGGAKDSLWAASLRPIIAKPEMGLTAQDVKTLFNKDPKLAKLFAVATGTGHGGLAAESVLVLAAKSLAAYQETLWTPLSRFDQLGQALRRGDRAGIATYPAAAARGLKIFIGKGQCNVCHHGPAFTNGEFASIGRPFFVKGGTVDKGRYGGIQAVKLSPYNRMGNYNDDPRPQASVLTRQVRLLPRNWGEFKVPSLRNISRTAPYMHDGSLASLADVVKHYSELDEGRLHTEGEAFLRALNLSTKEASDLVAFLKTL
jgi:cytochrome c peroxidase